MKVDLSQFSKHEELHKKLSRALEQDIPYSRRPVSTQEGAAASVLALFAMMGSEPGLLITKRTEKMETHKGQMAFPGGIREAKDADEIATALRETEEEVGVPGNIIEVIGSLPRLSTFTGFTVTPVIGLASLTAERIELLPNAHEIDEVFWVPLSQLLAPGVYREEFFQMGSVRYPISVFQWGSYRIWGATGVMIKNLLDRLASLS